MSMKHPDRPEQFLSRWSRRKLAAAREAAAPAPLPAAPAPDVATAPTPSSGSVANAPQDTSNGPIGAPALPSIDALTFESDFTAFLQPGVEPAVQRAALRKLLHDPRFNVMDGLDVYIDDYTKPSPLDPAIARMLADAQNLFVPRVDAAAVAPGAPTMETGPAGTHAAVAQARGEGASDDAPGAGLGAQPHDAAMEAVEPRESAQRCAAADPQQARTEDQARAENRS